jgi:hypothetical protein
MNDQVATVDALSCAEVLLLFCLDAIDVAMILPGGGPGLQILRRPSGLVVRFNLGHDLNHKILV